MILLLLQKLRKNDVLRLWESEQRLSDAYRIAQLAYWSVDLRTGDAWWSDRIFQMCGLDRSTVKPSHARFLELVHPADQKEFQKKLQSVMDHGSGDIVVRIVRPSGEVRYIHGYAFVTYDSGGKPVTLRGTNQDVTESRLTQIALEERESQLLAIYRNVAAILFLIEVEAGDRFRFTSVNEAFLASTGLEESQVIGKRIQEVIPPESIDLVLGKYMEAVRTRATVRWEELSRYPTGEKIGDVAVTPVLDRNGVVTHLSGSVYDITERRRLENELRVAIEIRDEFISIASHELKTPLTALYMQLQLLVRMSSRAGVALDPRISTMIKGSFESAQSLNDLLSDLLDVTRIRVGRLSLEPRVMDLREAVLESVARVQESATQRGSLISVRADHPILGKWDPMRIEQVLSNLLSNAIKYGKGMPIEITVSSDSLGGSARIQVRDRGVGIPQEMQAKIFERFQRAISGDKITGLGLGLYIVRQIVEAHCGTIRVESEPEKGALFTVELPTEARIKLGA